LTELKGNHDLPKDTITSRYTGKNKERKITEDPCTDLRILPPTSRRKGKKTSSHCEIFFKFINLLISNSLNFHI
jgi:hypothetical protein